MGFVLEFSFSIIDVSRFSLEQCQESAVNMRYHRTWEFIEGKPFAVFMDFWFQVFRSSIPHFYQKKCIFPIAIYIFCFYFYRIYDRFSVDSDTDFFPDFTDSSLECWFTCFYFSSRKSPIKWPVFCISTSLYEEIVWTMTENDATKLRKRHKGKTKKIKILQSDPTRNFYKNRKNISSEKLCFFEKKSHEICTDSSEEKSTDNISRIVNPTHNSCRYCYQCDEKSDEYEKFIFIKTDESYEKGCTEKSMSRRKWVIQWMRDERCDTSSDFLWTWTPFRNTKINNTIHEKSKYDRKNNLESPYFVSIIFFLYPT